MAVDASGLSQQQLALLRWIAERVGILANPDDPDAEASQFLEDDERARVIKRAKDKAIRWSSSNYLGMHRAAYQRVTDAQRASLSRSLKSLEQRRFISRLPDGRIKLTPAGHRYLVTYYLHDAAALLHPTPTAL